jgi:hypothetical protein
VGHSSRHFIAALSNGPDRLVVAARAAGTIRQGASDMKIDETLPTIIRGWLAPATDKRETEEQMLKIANAFFVGVTIFSIAFAYFVLSAKV